jgi:hypothetical protein
MKELIAQIKDGTYKGSPEGQKLTQFREEGQTVMHIIAATAPIGKYGQNHIIDTVRDIVTDESPEEDGEADFVDFCLIEDQEKRNALEVAIYHGHDTTVTNLALDFRVQRKFSAIARAFAFADDHGKSTNAILEFLTQPNKEAIAAYLQKEYPAKTQLATLVTSYGQSNALTDTVITSQNATLSPNLVSEISKAVSNAKLSSAILSVREKIGAKVKIEGAITLVKKVTFTDMEPEIMTKL